MTDHRKQAFGWAAVAVALHKDLLVPLMQVALTIERMGDAEAQGLRWSIRDMAEPIDAMCPANKEEEWAEEQARRQSREAARSLLRLLAEPENQHPAIVEIFAEEVRHHVVRACAWKDFEWREWVWKFGAHRTAQTLEQKVEFKEAIKRARQCLKEKARGERSGRS